jgi:hypothetical protein
MGDNLSYRPLGPNEMLMGIERCSTLTPMNLLPQYFLTKNKTLCDSLFIGPNNYINVNQVFGSTNQTTVYLYSYNEDDLPIQFQGFRNGEILVGNEHTYEDL